jgi:hypothetical protein
MALTIKRSPARVSWGVWFGSSLIQTTDTKWQAQAVVDAFNNKYPELEVLA